LELSRDVKDVFIATPAIADIVVRSSRRVYVVAKKTGQTNVYFYDAQ
jgi:pilus assembly protein CpaC